MPSVHAINLVKAIKSRDNDAAQAAFTNAMRAQASAMLDAKRIEVASLMFAKSVKK